MIDDGKVDAQQVRALRELTPEAIDLFEGLWRVTSRRDLGCFGINGDKHAPNRSYFKGTAVGVLVNRYERDREARKKCVANHGATCVMYGFVFRRTYGEFGKSSIHIHHLTPLASVGRRYKVDARDGLISVYPNCNAMLHRRHNPPGIDELREIVVTNRAR
jgi:5-methylcytosine-specific restriction protein A